MRLLDVIWIMDELIDPPHPKMVACVNPLDGWFFRINSRDKLRPCVPVVRIPHHTFLHHDSFLHCDILELDDYIIDESVRRRGVIGRIHSTLVDEIIVKLRLAIHISRTDQDVVARLLKETYP
jgi:hypothetical protein